MASFIFSNVCSSSEESVVGTKIVNMTKFMVALENAIINYDSSKDAIIGQMFVALPEGIPAVSAGVGVRTNNPDDYVARCHRGIVTLYLKRHKAAEVDNLNVVVYTTEAYLLDPEVKEDLEEFNRVKGSTATHVIVAVLASAGPRPPMSPIRFVSNLAGGNREAALWTADEIRQKAEEIKEYDDKWCVVAD